MKITEIKVTAGRTFNHPHEQFSNLRPEVVLTAAVDPNEDPVEAAKQLQAKAEELVEDHKNGLLRSLEQIANLRLREREVASLNQQLTSAQNRLTQIRAENPQLSQSAETTTTQEQ